MPAKKEGKVGCETMRDAEIWRLGVEVEDFVSYVGQKAEC